LISISLPLIKICEGDWDKITLENKVRKCKRRWWRPMSTTIWVVRNFLGLARSCYVCGRRMWMVHYLLWLFVGVLEKELWEKKCIFVVVIQKVLSQTWQWHYVFSFIFFCFLRTFKLLNGLNCESKGEDNGRRRSWGTFPSL